MFATLDQRDLVYTIVGLALLGLTLQPALKNFKFLNLPMFYVLFGCLFGVMGLPIIDPVEGGLQTSVVEHASELIVIISLAGAGLAIDTPATWRNWQPAFRMLIVAMPLTILAVYMFGSYWLGLSVGGAMLLAASLAPTDPVLAQSVQVSPPGGEEDTMRLTLTAEAGLNDGLAFPFVYLAVALATYGFTAQWADWGITWFTWDLIYRVAMGVIMGIVCGYLVSRVAFGRFGDASNGSWNSIVMVLSATLLSYGLTEAVDGYGFLAVFICARIGRGHARKAETEYYERFVHHGADQLEAILLAVLLLWLGSFIGAGALEGLRWQEVAFALALVFVIRPVAGYAAFLFYKCDRKAMRNVSFFGIRGMGSVFYIAYGQTHGPFEQMDVIWRIAAVTILTSIIVHGYAAKFFLPESEDLGDVHPYKDHLRRKGKIDAD